MKKTATVFIPHYGCPNDCIFCNQVKIAGKDKSLDYNLIQEGIMRDISTMKREDVVEVAFFGGSFTAIDEQVQEKCLSIVDTLRHTLDREIQIKLSTRPDAIDEDVIRRLLKYKVDTVELGVQSLDEEVLKKSNRGHSVEDVYRASKWIQEAGLKLGIQIMIGLPLDTEIKFKNTVKEVIQIQPQVARIYPVLVIKDTQLEKMYLSGEYEPISLEDAVKLSKYAYEKFQKHSINVIRIGLQATDTINIDKDVVAGPFHSAFGELVINQIYRDKIETLILKKGLSNMVLEVDTPKRCISKIIGNRKSNVIYFKDKYNIDMKIHHNEGNTVKIQGETVLESHSA